MCFRSDSITLWKIHTYHLLEHDAYELKPQQLARRLRSLQRECLKDNVWAAAVAAQPPPVMREILCTVILLIPKAISHRKAAAPQHWLPMRSPCSECRSIHANGLLMHNKTHYVRALGRKQNEKAFMPQKTCMQAEEYLLNTIISPCLKLPYGKQCN